MGSFSVAPPKLRKEHSVILNDFATLRRVEPENRVLLLPHCLRPSQRCTARYDRDKGLLCKSCSEDCPINQLKTSAEARGFGDVCIAPGGSLALRYVETRQPEGIVAVACGKELKMGIEAIMSLSNNGGSLHTMVIVTVPLFRDGCVDTGVDLEAVMKVIDL
jgi:hypothetical protein